LGHAQIVERKPVLVVRQASDLPADPAFVVTHAEEDCSPAAFRIMIDRRLGVS